MKNSTGSAFMGFLTALNESMPAIEKNLKEQRFIKLVNNSSMSTTEKRAIMEAFNDVLDAYKRELRNSKF